MSDKCELKFKDGLLIATDDGDIFSVPERTDGKLVGYKDDRYKIQQNTELYRSLANILGTYGIVFAAVPSACTTLAGGYVCYLLNLSSIKTTKSPFEPPQPPVKLTRFTQEVKDLIREIEPDWQPARVTRLQSSIAGLANRYLLAADAADPTLLDTKPRAPRRTKKK